MQKILIISGKKQSGKSSLCNFLHGYTMAYNKVISAFDLNDEGQLLVNTRTIDADGHTVEGVGVLDIERKDYEFESYAHQNIWPYVKVYSFADELKMFLIRHFGLTWNQCYGSNDDKETITSFRFCDFSFALDNDYVSKVRKAGKYKEHLTARQVMQLFGTNVCRKIYEACWSRPTFEKILAEQVPLAIITDARFISEIELGHEYGARCLRLARCKYEDSHASENELNNYDGFDAILDNSKITMREKNNTAFQLLKEWEWIEGSI